MPASPGPVVRQLMETFAFDWHFTTKEVLEGADVVPGRSSRRGPVVARGIPDGPDEDFETLHDTILERAVDRAPVGADRHSVLPARRAADRRAPRGLDARRPGGPRAAAEEQPDGRGVGGDGGARGSVLKWGVPRLASRAPPFDHSKIMIVDGTWSMLGSANWDPAEPAAQLRVQHRVLRYGTGAASSPRSSSARSRRRGSTPPRTGRPEPVPAGCAAAWRGWGSPISELTGSRQHSCFSPVHCSHHRSQDHPCPRLPCADWRARIEKIIDDLQPEIDELKVKLHLAKADAKDESGEAGSRSWRTTGSRPTGRVTRPVTSSRRRRR